MTREYRPKAWQTAVSEWTMSRRSFAAGLAGAGALAVLGLPGRPAVAKTTITWMGWQGYETPITSGTFLADNDIDFQPTFISSNEEIITKLQAGGVGKTDLITMYFGYLPLMAEGELIEPIDASRIAAFADLVPQFTGQSAIRHQDQLMGVPWNWGSLPIMYDPAIVTAPPASWKDVMKPEYKGKVAMVDDPLGNLLVWGRTITGAEVGTLLSKEQLAQVIDFLIEVKTKQARAFFATYGDMADAFARNEVVITTIGWEAVAVWAQQKGKTIAYSIPQEGTGLFMDCLCIPKDCPHPDLVYSLINHIVSPEPQKQFATEQSAGITNLKAVPLLTEELQKSYHYGDIDNYMKLARLFPVPPTEEGEYATYDDFLEEYERLKRA
jgi:spermidine/putrescine-binding protein